MMPGTWTHPLPPRLGSPGTAKPAQTMAANITTPAEKSARQMPVPLLQPHHPRTPSAATSSANRSARLIGFTWDRSLPLSRGWSDYVRPAAEGIASLRQSLEGRDTEALAREERASKARGDIAVSVELAAFDAHSGGDRTSEVDVVDAGARADD